MDIATDGQKYILNLENIIGNTVHKAINSGRIPYELSKNAGKFYSGQCNSPSNIRKIWITLTGVYVEYYMPYLKTWRRDANIEFKQYDKNMLNGMSMKRIVLQEAARDAFNASMMNVLAIQGRPLRFMQHPYAVTNIEELYFDYHLLAPIGSEKYIETISSQNSYNSRQELYMMASDSNLKGYHGSMMPLMMLGDNINVRVTNSSVIHKKFPRLKYVGLICNLDNFMKKPMSAEIITSMSGGTNKAGYWMTYNMSRLMGATLSYVSALKLSDNLYSAKEGVYKFDDEVLIKYFKEHGAKAS